MSVKSNSEESLMISSEVDGLSVEPERNVIFYNFDDNQGNCFNYITSTDTIKPYIGMRSILHISKEPLGDFILVSSSKDKFGKISHDFKNINPNEIFKEDDRLTVTTDYNPEFFRIFERFNISLTFENN